MQRAFIRKQRELDEQRQLTEQLNSFYEQMPADEFLAFCAEAGVPDETVNNFMEGYTWRCSDLRWSKRARDFLRETLSDGEPLPTSTIKTLAIANEIIGDDDADWQRLRKLASRDGLTNCPQHAHWQLK